RRMHSRARREPTTPDRKNPRPAPWEGARRAGPGVVLYDPKPGTSLQLPIPFGVECPAPITAKHDYKNDGLATVKRHHKPRPFENPFTKTAGSPNQPALRCGWLPHGRARVFAI